MFLLLRSFTFTWHHIVSLVRHRRTAWLSTLSFRNRVLHDSPQRSSTTHRFWTRVFASGLSSQDMMPVHLCGSPSISFHVYADRGLLRYKEVHRPESITHLTISCPDCQWTTLRLMSRPPLKLFLIGLQSRRYGQAMLYEPQDYRLFGRVRIYHNTDL